MHLGQQAWLLCPGRCQQQLVRLALQAPPPGVAGQTGSDGGARVLLRDPLQRQRVSRIGAGCGIGS